MCVYIYARMYACDSPLWVFKLARNDSQCRLTAVHCVIRSKISLLVHKGAAIFVIIICDESRSSMYNQVEIRIDNN